ncbi:MAG: 50S ribosomal protein L24 [Candidatus Margulisiibacteriota bacterium]
MANLKKGDKVFVLSGKDKDKTGEILRVIPKKSAVVVADINIAVHYVKGNARQAGEIVKKPAPFPISKVALYKEK